MGIIKTNAMLEEYSRRFSLSSLCEVGVDELVGMIFLKNIFELTNTTADPKAQRSPTALEADISNEHASMTPIVKGRSDMYVFEV